MKGCLAPHLPDGPVVRTWGHAGRQPHLPMLMVRPVGPHARRLARPCLQQATPQEPPVEPQQPLIPDPAHASMTQASPGHPDSQGHPSQEPLPQSSPASSNDAYASGDTSQARGTPIRPRSIYKWPLTKYALERPPFLQQYPAGTGIFNINSFLGKKDVHEGKFCVPASQYQQFLTEYYSAFKDGYQLFLAEVYGALPFRYFLELDFDWDAPESTVKEAFFRVYPIIRQCLRTYFKLNYPPTCLVSMRTPYKVHINCPNLVTTELQAMQCRDQIIEQCKAHPDLHHDALDWEKVVDFPHGSFRMLGSRKSKWMVTGKEPAWVADKAYYPVSFHRDRGWQPEPMTLELVLASSIIPTERQIKTFENSPAYLNIIFKDMSAYQEKLSQRQGKKLAVQTERLAFLTEAIGSSGDEAEQQEQQEQAGPDGSSKQQAEGTGLAAGQQGGADKAVQAQLQQGMRVAALRRQEEAGLKLLAKRSGQVGQAYLEAVDQLHVLQTSLGIDQKRLSFLARSHQLQAAQGLPVSPQEAEELQVLKEKVKVQQRSVAQHEKAVAELADRLVQSRNDLPADQGSQPVEGGTEQDEAGGQQSGMA